MPKFCFTEQYNTIQNNKKKSLKYPIIPNAIGCLEYICILGRTFFKNFSFLLILKHPFLCW